MPQRKTSSTKRVTPLLRPSARFFRSVNLERDFSDSRALDGFIVTPHIREHIATIVDSLRSDSSRRAWRVTGDYGCGKSMFALALARSMSPTGSIPDGTLREMGLANVERPSLFPVLVTGTRASLGRSISAAIRDATKSAIAKKRLGGVGRKAALLADRDATDTEVAQLVGEFASQVRATRLAGGLLLVIDELGRFLEFSALNPHLQDIALYQILAETAARSAGTPILLVGLLHEGFAAYADHLSPTAQREWEKVSGRYDELVFAHPLEQTAMLAAEALGVQAERLPKATARQARAFMMTAIAQGWYGASPDKSRLADLAPRLFPIHPCVLPVAASLFGRFGQNERSLFSFLVSQDSFAIQAFVRERGPASFYRLADLYDHARSAFGRRLAQSGYRSHWPVIESTVESYPAQSRSELAVLKTVAMMNMALSAAPPATVEALELAVAGWSDTELDTTKKAVMELRDRRRVLYSRGVRGGLCLWPNTSVDLDRCHEQASQAVPAVGRSVPFLLDELRCQPIVARRHYIQTGTLRQFGVRLLDGRGLSAEQFAPDPRTDGQVFVILCETDADHAAAADLVRGPMKATLPSNWLVGVSAPVAQLQGLVTELRRWEWVIRNVPELLQDRYAREEAERQLSTARSVLKERMGALVDIGASGAATSLVWFQQGRRLGHLSGRELLARVSAACDATFPLAPRLRNELVNRRRPSSAAAAARLRLIGRLLETPDQPMLGMDASRRPPEASMYLSVLRAGGLHRKTTKGWRVGLPQAGTNDPLGLAPAFDFILRTLQEVPDARVRVGTLLQALASPPYGVREGLTPLLLAVVMAAHEDMIALYEHGAFLPTVTEQDFQRLLKLPETFELQFCQITTIRRRVFRQLLALFAPEHVDGPRSDDILAVVRPLCEFAAQLPHVVRRTARLSTHATRVRDALLDAREPIPLVFTQLPVACGVEPIASGRAEHADRYVNRLREALDEMRAAYPTLVAGLVESIARAFGFDPSTPLWRDRLASASDAIQFAVTDPGLRLLCLRLSDRSGADQAWAAALAAHITGKPVVKWDDSDDRHFAAELPRWAAQFRRVEATAAHPTAGTARISVTFPDGRDLERIVTTSDADGGAIDQAVAEMRPLVAARGNAAIVGMVRILWERFAENTAQAPTDR